MKHLFIVIALLFSISSFAFEDCRPAKWPYSRKQKKSDYVKIFEQETPTNLNNFLMGELKTESTHPLAYYLAVYLRETEPGKNTIAFYETLIREQQISEKGHKKYKGSLTDLCLKSMTAFAEDFHAEAK